MLTSLPPVRKFLGTGLTISQESGLGSIAAETCLLIPSAIQQHNLLLHKALLLIGRVWCPESLHWHIACFMEAEPVEHPKRQALGRRRKAKALNKEKETTMRTKWIAVGVIAVVLMACIYDAHAAFHGKDAKLGMVSRASLTPDKDSSEPEIGLYLCNVHGKEVQVGFSSINPKLKDIKEDSATLVVDGSSFALGFVKQEEEVLMEANALPNVPKQAQYRYTFKALPTEAVAALKGAKQVKMSFSLGTKTCTNLFDAYALQDIHEVAAGKELLRTHEYTLRNWAEKAQATIMTRCLMLAANAASRGQQFPLRLSNVKYKLDTQKGNDKEPTATFSGCLGLIAMGQIETRDNFTLRLAWQDGRWNIQSSEGTYDFTMHWGGYSRPTTISEPISESPTFKPMLEHLRTELAKL